MSRDARGRATELEGDEHRLLVESIADYAIYLLDPDGHVRTWNVGAERIYGYPRDEVIGRHVSLFYPPESEADRSARDLERARAARFTDEGWRIRRDGSRFWAHVVITPLFAEDGTLRGLGKVTRDLTERRRAEELRQSEQRYRQLSAQFEVILGSVVDGITVQSHAGLVYANAAAAKLCGFDSPEAMLRATGDEIVARFEMLDERGRPFSPDAFPGRRVLRGETAEPTFIRVRSRAAQREWWTLVGATAVRGESGEVELAVNVMHDVTATRRLEEASRLLAAASGALGQTLDELEALQALASALVPELADYCDVKLLQQEELVPAAVAHADPRKQAFARDLQARYPRVMASAQGSAHVARTGQAFFVPSISDEMLRASAHDEEHFKLARSLGLRSAMFVPIRVRGELAGVMTLVSAESARIYDTEHLALAEEIGRRAGVAIEHAQLYREARDAVQVREAFLSIAGHELNTPLTSLRLQLQSVLSSLGKADARLDRNRLAERVQKTLGHTARLERLVRDLLDVSRISSRRLALERERFDLVALVEEVIERHSHELQRTGSVVTLRAPPSVNGSWDRSRIDQAISNLLSNAMKYGAGEPIEVDLVVDEHVARIRVRDHGIGIAAEDHARIFGRFERATTNHGGLGLGLWIAREVVEAHAGRVFFESAKGAGSTFTIELPFAPAAETMREEP